MQNKNKYMSTTEKCTKVKQKNILKLPKIKSRVLPIVQKLSTKNIFLKVPK